MTVCKRNKSNLVVKYGIYVLVDIEMTGAARVKVSKTPLLPTE